MNAQPRASSNTMEIAYFLLLTFGITWGLQIPGVLAKDGVLPGGLEPYLPFVMLGVLGPTAAAWFLTQRRQGKKAVQNLFCSLYSGLPPLPWVLLALILPGLTLTIPLLVARILSDSAPIAYPPKAAGALVVAVIISLGEEVGWRGYALPRLAAVYGRVQASLILGVIWAIWHVPMFLGVDVPISAFPVMLVYFLGGSIVFSWLYFRTRGSLLIAVLAHVGAHLNNSHQALPSDSTPLTLHAIGWSVAAGFILFFDRDLWRSQLGIMK